MDFHESEDIGIYLKPILSNKNYTYYFDKNNCILFKKYVGDITLEDIYSSWTKIILDKIIPGETLGIVVDYRKAHFQFEVNKYYLISNFYKDNIETFGNRKIAILSQRPRDMAVLILVQLDDEGYSTKPFSSLKAAIQWISFDS